MSAFVAFGTILLLLLAVVVVSALRDREADLAERAEADPEARLDAALAALREVEFDYRTGKLDEEEYRRLREAYGVQALRARDEVAGAPGGDEPALGRASAAAGGDEAGAAVCGACGEPLRREARFCARCGEPRPAPG